ncbi:sialate O-acetylesterase [Sphingobacterium alkalisoli]|uniref:Sialate O-acetylesterase n=2 Tax=Sphingobacterium alkalisoli TaxID=1874115 RepID=A0A4U0H3F6_9SPHI|nr:sialate O-acetylesterase [Sphingobacterium alkalisoli]GGH18543.1 9-O-acetylesterase [Sphingobacterium alkalisoli]
MVLQRNTEVYIWGWGRAGQQVLVAPSWTIDTITCVVSGEATWKTKIVTPDAGGPYTIQIHSQGQHLELNDVLIGEVWLCSGQSNMQWSARNNVKEIKEILPTINNKNIRLLQVSNIAAQTPQDNIFDQWTECNPTTVESFSAIGYFFADRLHRELDVPIGIINSSWGGTSAEFWTPKEEIAKDPELVQNALLQKPAPRKPYQPGVLWNSMIYPLVHYKIAGVLWYQGEDNTISYSGYDKLIQTMVLSWRSAWNHDFPFYFVQIAPYTYKYKIPNAALLREQQTKTALNLPHAGMVVTTDLVDNIKDIHPQQKKAVAHRLADLALVYPYRREMIDFQSPIYRDYRIENDKMRIFFHHLYGNLHVEGKEIVDLYIAGEDKVFHPADFKLDGKELLVFSKKVNKPAAVRFGFTNTSMPNLFTETGLPVAPFRTDNWNQF